jgi:hypothetical protein
MICVLIVLLCNSGHNQLQIARLGATRPSLEHSIISACIHADGILNILPVTWSDVLKDLNFVNVHFRKGVLSHRLFPLFVDNTIIIHLELM